MREFMLTTKDNPYSPFTQFDEWYAFDERKGYSTTEYLARVANLSNEMSEEEEETSIDNAINEIIYYNITGNYKKVFKEEEK